MKKAKEVTKKATNAFTVSRYSLSGQFLETYANCRVAAEAMGTNQQFIIAAARLDTKVHTACGYLWRRGIAPEIDVKSMLKEQWFHSSPLAKQQHTVAQYDLKGNLVATHTNSITAAKAVGVHQNGIRDVIKGRGLTYGGFIWSNSIKKKIDVNPRITTIRTGISQYDLDGRWIRTYKSCLAAERATSIDHSTIHLAVHGVTVTAGRFLWRRSHDLRINVNELRRHPHYAGSFLEKHLNAKRQQSTKKQSGQTDAT